MKFPTSMHLTNAEAKNLSAAWSKAESMSSPGQDKDGFFVTGKEFGDIVAAAKKDDCKVSNSEAKAIVYRSLEGYTDFTASGRRALDAFESKHGMNENGSLKKIFGE